MKLRNKKTGEILDDAQYRNYSLSNGFGFRMNGKEWEYHSLAELNDEWEDYEEPKGYWFIDVGTYEVDWCEENEDTKADKEIGNYFSSREEAEKAVEKIKAWKRLKDKGFEFVCFMRRSDWAGLPKVVALENLIDITANLPKDKIKEMEADLNLLFGGEDE